MEMAAKAAIFCTFPIYFWNSYNIFLRFKINNANTQITVMITQIIKKPCGVADSGIHFPLTFMP